MTSRALEVKVTLVQELRLKKLSRKLPVLVDGGANHSRGDEANSTVQELRRFVALDNYVKAD